ncbi:uncharacterized protein OCT59_021103 [Rhizophagus irregularis]|uniref:Kelch-like protein 17 n=2 Tax=Rhizophagus irregularis TaxID=588596 RepID=A0A015JVT7_RHIIW|nr:hypothetical protein RirG_058460 [Rhizophagus irregularis DAOM 197198w]UZO02624.1 hypothetical protein OCT59_021103 [Rhizophagus irregularis]GBC27025.1 carbohydrate-binding module family 13 protein [Rhizophagus irregularis DAOM 181602=DAOM 197198]
MVRFRNDRYVYLQKLSQNLLEILDDDEYYDITIEVGDDPHVKIFRAHIAILNYRSFHLRRILSTNKKKSDGTLTHIKLPNILPEIFQIILRYIYGGIILYKEYDASDIVKILIAANELGLQELIPNTQLFLIKYKADWIEQNFNFIFRTYFENDSFSELQNFCTELISKQSEKIFNSTDFTSISENLLISLIQHDNLQMREVQIWEHVLKWGIGQNPELSSDPSSYSNDNYNTLKNTLQQCISFIKFYNLTSKEFLDSVFPYRKVLPEELYNDLLKTFLNHDYRPSNRKIKEIKEIDSNENIDSKIITNQHVELISKWIDRLENTNKLNNLYKFELILRGSRDGFTFKKFHEICDNRSHTVTIIEVKNSNEILGGYNPIKWDSKSKSTIKHYGKTKNSFIFSFKEDINDYILSRVVDESYAVNYFSYYGPSFGIGDLTVFGGLYASDSFCNNTNFCKKFFYEKQIRNTFDHFSIEEYEVFQINIKS